MDTRIPAVGAAALLLLLTGAAPAQDDANTATAASAQELLEALRAAGVDVSGVTTLNDDGTVSVQLPDPPKDAPGRADAKQLEQEARELAADRQRAEPEAVWDYKLTLGFSYSDGNTENASFAGAFVATREVEDVDKLTLDASYFYAQDSGDTSDNKFTSGALYEINLDEKWLWFIRGRYDYDQFKSWDHRISASTGPGYKWIDTDEFSFTTFAGAGAFKEFGSNRNEIVPEGLLGAELEWNFAEGQSITASSTYFPSFSSIDDFRLVNTAGYKAEIAHADGLSFSIGFLHEHESIVDPGVERNDFKLFGGLTFDF